MSFQDDWPDDWRDAAREAEAARYYHRGPDGRAAERIFLNKPPRGAAPAAQWERLCEVAHSTKHADIEADRLDGLMIGAAFIKHVIKDPKVQACGAWLCLEYPEFGPLFSVGVFEGIKENSPYGPPVIFRRDKWPVLQVDLSSDFARVASRGECHDYMAAPEERSNSLSHTAHAIADRQRAFFDLFRNSELIAEGVSESLFTQAIPADQWNRPDRYLDITLNDLLCIEPTTSGFSSRRILNGVKLRLAAASKLPLSSASIRANGPAKMVAPVVDEHPEKLGGGKSSIAAETKCRKWLMEEMQKSPRRPQPKENYVKEAQQRFGVSKRGFDRAWTQAVEKTGSGWMRPGAPKKSPHLNPRTN
jgi:hypothetical protein